MNGCSKNCSMNTALSSIYVSVGSSFSATSGSSLAKKVCIPSAVVEASTPAVASPSLEGRSVSSRGAAYSFALDMPFCVTSSTSVSPVSLTTTSNTNFFSANYWNRKQQALTCEFKQLQAYQLTVEPKQILPKS